MSKDDNMEQGDYGRAETLRVGKSFTTKRPDLEKYAARLKALDR